MVVEHIKQFPGQVHGEEVQREVAARWGDGRPGCPDPDRPGYAGCHGRGGLNAGCIGGEREEGIGGASEQRA